MNALVLTCLLCFVVCSDLGALGSEDTFSSGLSHVTGGPASGEGLQTTLSDDELVEVDEEPSGGAERSHVAQEAHLNERRKTKGKGKRRNRHKSKSTTALNPGHTLYTSGYTSTHTITEDPCTSTHLSYCIHGFCKYMEDLQEPVCVCMKGFDGERCGIQTLQTVRNGEEGEEAEQRSTAELVQTVLVIIAVVLSVISCTAILLMTCAHYRTHKNFLAAYLGTGAEQEKLQKPISDIMV